MAARVVASQLIEIIDTDKDDSVLDSQFIDTAHVFVEENLSGKGLSETVLAKIELYLAAHFLAITEERGGLVVDHLGEATERYADVYKGGLKLTRYGHQAVMMDPTGTLNKFDSEKKALFRVV